MPDTFIGFREGFGAGPRGSDCLICQETVAPDTPTICHEGVDCEYMFCHQCFMSHVIHVALVWPPQTAKCPACRAIVQVNYNEASRAQNTGTDGALDGAFWPLFKNYVPNQDNIASDVEKRRRSLQEFGVEIDEYDRSAYLERAIICPSVEAFLNHVFSRGNMLSQPHPIHTLTQRRYIRYNTGVSNEFVRWLNHDRSMLRPSFVRWCIRDESTRRLHIRDTGLTPLVWRGLIPAGQDEMPGLGNDASGQTTYGVFRFAKNWYLVPSKPGRGEQRLERQFWRLGQPAWDLDWNQQGEILLNAYNRKGDQPKYLIALGAVGPLTPFLGGTYILRSGVLNNHLGDYPGLEFERRVAISNSIPSHRFVRDLDEATADMPGCPKVAVHILEKFCANKFPEMFDVDVPQSAVEGAITPGRQEYQRMGIRGTSPISATEDDETASENENPPPIPG